MERGRRMMEKWGWKDGDGLGKDRSGMTTCLNVRTDRGYATVEQMSPVNRQGVQQRPCYQGFNQNQQQQQQCNPLQFNQQQQQSRFSGNPQFSPRQSQFNMPQRQSQFGQQVQPRFSDNQSGGTQRLSDARMSQISASVTMQRSMLPMQRIPEPRQSRFDMGDPGNNRQSQFNVGDPSTPRQSRFGMGDPERDGRPQSPYQRTQGDMDRKRDIGGHPEDAPHVEQEPKRQRRSKWDLGSGGEQLPRPENSVGPYAVSKAPAMSKASRQQSEPMGQSGQDRPGDGRPGQDDWRWSKGDNHNQDRNYTELHIPMDKKDYVPELFGPHMRFTSRFADLFDCEASISAAGTVIIRPRSSGANLAGGVTVIEEVLAQRDPVKLHELKQEYTIKFDPESELRVRERQGSFAQAQEDQRQYDVSQQNATRHRHGLGDNSPKEPQPQADVFEMLNIDSHNVDLVLRNVNELQLSSGALFGIAPNGNVCMQGSRNSVDKGKQAVRTLITTGRVDSNFVKSTDSTSVPPRQPQPQQSQMPQAPQPFQGQAPMPPQPPMPPTGVTAQSQVPEHILKLQQQFQPPHAPPMPPVPSEVTEVVLEVSMDKALIVQCMLGHITKCSEAENCQLSQEVVRNKKSVTVKGKRAAHEKVKAIIHQLEECGQSSILGDYLQQSAMQPKPAAPPAPPAVPAPPAPEMAMHGFSNPLAAPSQTPCPPKGPPVQNAAAQQAVQSLQAALSGSLPPPEAPPPAPEQPSGIPGLESMSSIPGLGGLPWLGGLPLGNIPLPPVQAMVQPGMAFGLPGAAGAPPAVPGYPMYGVPPPPGAPQEKI